MFSDIIAIIKDVGNIETVFSKDGRQFEKKEIQLIDDTDEVTN